MPTQSLERLLNRLESVTQRLESALGSDARSAHASLANIAPTVAPVAVQSAAPTAAPSAAVASDQHPIVKAFVEIQEGPLKLFLALSVQIGGVVADQVRFSSTPVNACVEPGCQISF
jgi:hypothetical protein